MRSVLYNEKVLKFNVTGFTSPAESKQLADKVIELLENYNGTQDEMGRLKRYLAQPHRYTKSQERDILSVWGVFERRKKKRAGQRDTIQRGH